ncbi:MAG: WXG100 family type VII secretion target [Propionibacteriaceae bacterium]|jgi:hypothetical protein|nr:WXG100 family type VII secretion target [Propionibacteriaceae bacterium]
MIGDKPVLVDTNAVIAGAVRIRAVEDDVDSGVKDFGRSIGGLAESWVDAAGIRFAALADAWLSEAETWIGDLGVLTDGMQRAILGIRQATEDSAEQISGLDPSGSGPVSAEPGLSFLDMVSYHAGRLSGEGQ